MSNKLPLFISILSLAGVGIIGLLFWQDRQRLTQLDTRSQQLLTSVEILLTAQKAASMDAVPPPTQPSLTVTEIIKKIDALTTRVASLEQKSSVSTSTQTSSSSTQSSQTSASAPPREYIIYLGSGSTINRDWTLIPSAGVTLDISKYRHVRSVQFEAGLSIVSGEVYARLFDQSTQTPFYSSAVSNNTSAGTWVTSPSLTLPSGSRYYTVQLRSSNGEVAQLVGARLKIVAD